MTYYRNYNERANRESIIRSTIQRDPHSGLRPAEVETAVRHGMTISDSQKGLNWGQIKDAAVAVTKAEHS